VIIPAECNDHATGAENTANNQESLLMRIMNTWPEKDDSDRWDNRMSQFLAEIRLHEEQNHTEVIAPLLEWQELFERLQPDVIPTVDERTNLQESR
jgi:hypothetical protein